MADGSRIGADHPLVMQPGAGLRPGDCELSIFLNPFSADRIILSVPPGQKLGAMIEAFVPDRSLWGMVRVWIANEDLTQIEHVPPEYWDRVAPLGGAHVIFRVVPQKSGGSKSIIRIVLTIAISVAAFYAAPAIAGLATAQAIMATGATSIGFATAVYGATYALASGAINLVGRMLIDAFIPPPKPALSQKGGQVGDASPTYSLTGTSNKANPFGAVPRIFGRNRVFPPLAAVPYMEVTGQTQQYLRMLFDIGLGPLKISELKIGRTDLFNLEGVEVGVARYTDLGGVDTAPAGTYYIGFPDDTDNIPLYPRQVIQDAYSILLVKTLSSNPENIRSFATEADEGVTVLYFPGGLSDADGISHHAIAVKQGFREIGTTNWYPMIPSTTKKLRSEAWDETAYLIAHPEAASWVNTGKHAVNTIDHWMTVGSVNGDFGNWDHGHALLGNCAIDGATLKPFWFTFKTPKLDPTKRYEFRMQLYTLQDPEKVENCQLSAAQSFRNHPPENVKGHAFLALRIKANEQLNGVIQDFNLIAEAILPTWNGSAWVPNQITRNAAWAVAEVLRGAGNARPIADSRIDLAGFKAAADYFDNLNANGNPQAYFDGVFDQKSTISQVIQLILTPCRASLGMKDGKYTIVYDDVRTTPTQLFTPRNSWGFKSRKTFVVPPHGIKARFINPDKDWQQDEILVYDDGYSKANATLYESQEWFGVTRAEQAHWMTRYFMAANKLRPEVYDIMVDIEGLLCRRGDLIRVGHDVPRWGLAWGRVKSLVIDSGNVTDVILDEYVQMFVGKTYAMRGRKKANSQVLSTLAAPVIDGLTNVLTLATPTPTASMPEVGDLVAFGEADRETVLAIVKNIYRLDDMNCRIEFVDYAPEIFDADTDPIPAYDTQSTWAAQGTQAPPPDCVVLEIESDESALIELPGGWQPTIRVQIERPEGAIEGASRPDDYVQIRWRPIDTNQPFEKLTYFNNPLDVRAYPVAEGIEYEVAVQRVSAIGRASNWVEAGPHTVIGRTTQPANVTGASAQIRNDDVLLYWTANPEHDIAGYAIRQGTDWDTATPLEGGKLPTTVTTQYAIPAGPAGAYTYLVKAVDVLGLLSVDAVAINYTIVAAPAPSPSALYAGDDVLVSWAAVKGSFRTSFYRVRIGGGASVDVLTTNYKAPVSFLNATIEVWAVDVGGNEGAVGSVGAIVTAPNAPGSLTISFNQNNALLTWTAAAPGSLPVSGYEIRYGGSAWADAVLLGRIDTTSFITLANWTGGRTIRVRAYDRAGNLGTEATLAAFITAPATVAPSYVIDGPNIILSWAAPASTIPIREYEVREGASWAAGVLVAIVAGTSVAQRITWSGGSRTYWVVARTLSEFESTPGSVAVAISVANAPALAAAISGVNMVLSWPVPSSPLPIARYEVREDGASFGAATFIAYTDTTSFTHRVDWTGSKKWWVAAIDEGGNTGSAGSVDVAVVVPGVPTSVTVTVIDNNVMLKWAEPATGSLPVDHYEIRRGATFAGATVLGTKGGTFAVFFETASGTYTYWIVAVDAAGNYGTETSINAIVSSPPDYVLAQEWSSDFSGTKTNCELIDGKLSMPLVTGRTWTQHFTDDSWTTIQDQIDAGFPLYIQPTRSDAPATYVETFDYGTTIDATTITMEPTYQLIDGDVTLSPKIEVAPAGSPASFTVLTTSDWQVAASNFRYVRITLSAEATDRTGLVEVSALRVKLDLKIVRDAGNITANSGDSGGTTVTFNVPYKDIDSITVTPQGTTALIAVVDFTDAPNPTDFKVLLFNTSGVRQTGTVRWAASGV